ncbi:MAG: 4Fe-4S binding protein [Zestosphaera sp.]|uniref:4Fe-4S ferredoxin iron-sulfur binding domain-containing protein (SreD-like ferredoxin) n=1 Tax=Metallosphaera cuprina (strain Ar-4) TaxID=1006006 RepID=F4FY24_METCR|nr:4Fe-4S binding protein [Metallosphaera cuprina]AEB95397.1 4Fe-4S ferredoxin iron-sulfur binding domain-containing protein (SreD-like ferredoxin) [Metallosphaera cuprina Ar-4]
MLNTGLLVTKKAREVIGDELLAKVFEDAKLSYAAEVTDSLIQDLKDNDVKSLLIINELGRERWMEELDQRVGISPLAITVLPSSWFERKGVDYVYTLIKAYAIRSKLMDLVYRVQPTRSPSMSRRSLLKLRLYEYKPYPVLFDEVHAEREINRAIEACPQGLVTKTPEGPSVSYPEKCSACGYCSGVSYLGYFEVPTSTTDQVVSFINTIVADYKRPASIIFTEEIISDVPEGFFPYVMPCVASLSDSFVLASYAAGLTPIVHLSSQCESVELAMKRLDEIPSRFPGTSLPVRKAKGSEELKEALSSPLLDLSRTEIPSHIPLNRARRRSLLIWALEEMGRKVTLNQEDEVPGVYNVVVDPNKCVLCGVCVRACQMLVPDLKGNDFLELSYNIPFCIGSERCVRNCPEKAVSVTGFARIADLKPKVVNRTNVSKCRMCGKPIGSEKVKGKVDALLISQGFSGTAKYTDVCNECKQKELTKIWVERILSGRK